MDHVVYGGVQGFPLGDFWTLFNRSVERDGDAIALVEGKAEYSYREIREWVLCVTEGLRQAGVESGRRVGLFMMHGSEPVISSLALSALGAVFVPIDVQDPAEKVSYILSSCEIDLVISNSVILAEFADKLGATRCLDFAELAAFVPPAVAVIADQSSTQTCPAYVLHTSGTTGVPKGVVISQAAWMNYTFCVIELLEIGPTDAVLLAAPYTFDISVMEMGLAFISGARLVVPSYKQTKSPNALAKVLQSQGVTVAFLTQRMALAIDPAPLTELRALVLGGELIIMKTVRRWATQIRKVLNIYGPTEMTVAPVYYFCDPELPTNPKVGLPMKNHYAYLVDPSDRNKFISEGMGEIVLGGAGTSLGYVRRNPKVPDPFGTLPTVSQEYSPRIYHTGDLGYWDEDGQLIYVGRSDDQVKLNGVRLELTEIDEIINRHPDVSIGVTNILGIGTGEQRLIAFIKPMRPGYTVDSLIEFLTEHLPRYKVPSKITYVDDFEYSRSGKLVRPIPQIEE